MDLACRGSVVQAVFSPGQCRRHCGVQVYNKAVVILDEARQLQQLLGR